MYPLSKHNTLGTTNNRQKRRKTQNLLNNNKNRFQPQFESFQIKGYQLSFHLLSLQKLKIQAISLQSLQFLKKKRQRERQRQQGGYDNDEQQQEEQDQYQDEFSFHHVYQLQVNEQYQKNQGIIIIEKNDNNDQINNYNNNNPSINKSTVYELYQLIKLLITRYRYQCKTLREQQLNKYQNKQLQQKQRNKILMNLDKIIQGFSSKYIQLQEQKGFNSKNSEEESNNNRRLATKLQGVRIKEEYREGNSNNNNNNYNGNNLNNANNNKGKNNRIVLKLRNILQKLGRRVISPNQINNNEGENNDQQQQQQLNNNNNNNKISTTKLQPSLIHQQNHLHNQPHFFSLHLNPRLLQSYQFSHKLITYNFHEHHQLKSQLNTFIHKTINTHKQLFTKTNTFISQFKQISDNFLAEAVNNVLLKINTSLKVRREKTLKYKQVPQQLTVNGVTATFQYRNQPNQKQPSNTSQINFIKQDHYNQPQLQIIDKYTQAVKIPIQFDQQTGSYHQFSISDNVVSRNGGSSYQILHFKYRLSNTGRYTCKMKLIKTYRRVCWFGIMQQETKYFVHTSKMQNCIVYHTCHGRIETHLKKSHGLQVVKKKARGMNTLYDGHWVKMVIDMENWEIEWELDDGVKTRCRIPQQLKGMALRPVVILEIIGDTVEFID